MTFSHYGKRRLYFERGKKSNGIGNDGVIDYSHESYESRVAINSTSNERVLSKSLRVCEIKINDGGPKRRPLNSS